MDPSIMKLLEEDEDESLHSGADVEAFQAALNRDIEGDTSTSHAAVLAQGSYHSSSPSFTQWQTSSQDENSNLQSREDLKSAHQQDQNSSEINLKQHGSFIETQQQQNDASQDLILKKQSQDDHRQGHTEQISPQFPPTAAAQISEKNSTPIHESDRMNNPDHESQYLKLQKMSNQQAMATELASNPMNRGKQVPFAMLLPVILPQLDKDRAMQLQTLYAKLKKNDIPKEGFVRHMRTIIGDQMLRLAVMQMQVQPGSNQFQSPQHHMRMPSVSSSASQFTERTQLNQKGYSSLTNPSHASSSAVQVQTASSYPTNVQTSRGVEHKSDSHEIQANQVSSSNLSAITPEVDHPSISIEGLNKQKHVQFSQTPFAMYGNAGSNYHQHPGTNVNTSAAASVKLQSHNSQMRQMPLHQSVGASQLGGATQGMNSVNVPQFERQNSLSHFASNSSLQQNSGHVKQEPIEQAIESQQKAQLSTLQGFSSFSTTQAEQGSAIPGNVKHESSEKQSSRMGFSTSTSTFPPNSASPSVASQMEPNLPLGSRISSVTIQAGINARTPQKKPSIGQKKTLEALGSSPPLASKKQKVSGAFSDQSIEQLNDVTAVSGVNLREEEEHLFSGPKEDSRVSEASRRVVQEEEEKLILQKIPMQKKLAEIMAKCGLKSISNDVERCLSLCVEERMRGLISNLIRLSKQRVDGEKQRHRTFIASDVRQQIITMNRKAREEWEKKQAEAEKLRKQNEPEDSDGVDGDKDKDEGRSKSLKVNKEEDDKMRTTAANVAARAAVGGDDMLSKWQLMAEQARQKREGVMDTASASQMGKDVSHKPLLTSGRNVRDSQEAEKRGHASSFGADLRKFGKHQSGMPQTRVARSICVKDIISVLEREPQMSRSTLMYRMYERIRSEAAAE